MTTRRAVLRLAGAAPAAVLLGACQPGRPGAPGPAGVAPAGSELLLVRTSAGLALVDTSDARVVVRSASGVSAWDGSFIAAGTSGATGTRAEVRDRTGTLSYAVDLAGALTPRVVAPGGRYVALATGSAAGATPYRPAGRAVTTLVVAGAAGERTRLTLPGCLEPEGFTPQCDALYVLDYLPPGQPDRYRVRLLDLASGSLGPLSTRDKTLIPAGAEEEMRGEGRQAVYSSTRTMLFTLYTHQPEHEHTRDLLAAGAHDDAPQVHTFVHSLNLDQRFAYCIDLPAPFGEGSAEGHAIALSPVSGHPYVIDATSGTIARLDGMNLIVDRTAKTLPGGADHASAAVGIDGAKLFVGAGAGVYVVRTSDLSVETQWTIAEPVRGLAISPDGARLWVGQPNSAIALNTTTGHPQTTLPLPHLVSIS